MKRNGTGSLMAALTVAATVIVLPTPLGARAATFLAGAAQGSMSDDAKFVGTYRLISTEVKDTATGEWAETPDFNRIGYITYADTGHMGVHLMPRSREPFASNTPTPAEAQVALQRYTAYFGSFTVDEKGQFVVRRSTARPARGRRARWFSSSCGRTHWHTRGKAGRKSAGGRNELPRKVCLPCGPEEIFNRPSLVAHSMSRDRRPARVWNGRRAIDQLERAPHV